MLGRLALMLSAVCSNTVCLAQTPKPVSTYTLHAHKERRNGFTLAPAPTLPSTVFLLAPDNSLLILVPQEDGEWVLKRLTDWNTPSPREYTLAITGRKIGDAQLWATGDLTVNSDATYAIVRLTYRDIAHGSNKPIAPEAVIVIVDLRQFSVVSRRMTSDPLLAASDWHFLGKGLLTAKVFLRSSPADLPDRPTTTATYEAATLGFPDLNTNASCRYDETTLCDPTNGCTKEVEKQATSDCANVVRSAGASGLSDLFGRDRIRDGIAKLAGRDCSLSSTSSDESLALFECRTGHGYLDGEVYITKSRTSTVLAVPERKPIFTMSLPHNFHEIPGVLATNNDGDYLLLLRDGVKLEVYRLPDKP